ncbi:MAG: DEAD/DEAH box helicase family protein [Verrucomicrobiae bacterium]|nr:DEAD/DEAH box helicase family protein [Verrucomicrobiae bacterium]
MILKDYQRKTLDTVKNFLMELHSRREKVDRIREVDTETADAVDWVAQAFKQAAPGRYTVSRRNGIGERLHNFCLKIPTGGGKTLLATRVIDLVNTHYRHSQRGLVLWIVPTTQIYNQTLRALKDRDHPYRQQLDLASAGRTLILEKGSGFSPADVEDHLCVLLLMLPSANRKTKETLRMFRDSGGFDRFFPREDNLEEHKALLEEVPNLDTFEKESGFWGRQIKTSLGNTLRLLKPLIILDEGHKAYSEGAKETLEGFNPCMIVELSATPPKASNVLVEITGKALNDEDMIKLDLNIENSNTTNWKDTLLAAVEHRAKLEKEAEKQHATDHTYIRPICVIQVERTGKDQRKKGLIHSEEVREYLLTKSGIEPEQIAVKTSQKDELKDVDDVGGLMDKRCPIRFIITKQALQEGWDCPFAYVLAILTNPSSKTALTQLVGRILRQPYARKTGNHWLDESYVFAFQRKGKDLLHDIRKGFGLEGLGDLQGHLALDGERQDLGPLVTKEVKEHLKDHARKLILPAFVIRDPQEGWRPVHYETDILSRVPWSQLNASKAFGLTLRKETGRGHMRMGLDEKILQEDPELTSGQMAHAADNLDYAFAACHLLDVCPNPWRGNELVRKVFGHYLKDNSKEIVSDNFVFILEHVREVLAEERDRLAHQVFEDLLSSGEMRFLVVAEDWGFNRLPKERQMPEKAKLALSEKGRPFQMNLFEDVLEDELNGLENRVASYMEDQEELFFWYRNAPRKDYRVQGWKRERIYADFIFALSEKKKKTAEPYSRVFVVETKGAHLKNEDTDYKRSVFDRCTELAKESDWAHLVPEMKSKSMRFEVIAEEEWKNRLNAVLELT